MPAAVAASILALVLPGGSASAAYANHTLALTLRYEMVCGQPGPGPLTVQLPQRWRLQGVRVAGRRSTTSGRTVTISIPGPKGVTCMSITMGTLRLRISGIDAPAGSYIVKAGIRKYAFTAHLRIP